MCIVTKKRAVRLLASLAIAAAFGTAALAQPKLSKGDERGSFVFNEGNDTGAANGGDNGGSSSQ